MKDINIEINVCDSTGKSTCTVNPPIQLNPHSCCHPDNGGGQEPGVSGVASVFGRTGVVTAQAGDYTADQITETATRKFATPDEKAVWNAKQDALISGTTIRTLFGQSLLGSGNISLTPSQMGVAAADHTHTTADITDYTQKTKQLIHSSLEAGAGVTLSYNPMNEKTIISAAGGSGTGGSGYIVADRQGATAGENHAFSISPQNTFNLAAYALKEEAGAVNQTYVVDDFNASSEPNYNATNAVIFDGQLQPYMGGIVALSESGGEYFADIKSGAKSLSISDMEITSIVPDMESNESPSGYTISSSSTYSTTLSAWMAFSSTNSSFWNSEFGPTAEKPQWLRVDLPTPKAIGGYSIQNRLSSVISSPRSWRFEGSHDGITWETLHSVNNDTNNNAGIIREYRISSSVAYSSYRIIITESSPDTNYVVIQNIKLFPHARMLINGSDNAWYTVNNGLLENIGTADFSRGFSSSGTINGSDISAISPFSVHAENQRNIKLTYLPNSQIVISKSLLSASVDSWAKINAATLTATQTGNGKVRVAVTRDLINWHVLRNGAWVDVGTLSADTTGAEALIADGMTPAELCGITAAQWTQLFASNNGVPDSLAFAFALDITDPVTDLATIDRLVLNVNDASSWKVQSPAEVEIRWRTNSVTFRTATAGNYKLAYQVP
ncbi:discoidin domain-containing protein [Pectobacterium brasiliense]|uniref:discoidin domain-containing protein n=1 Tax=Pectobacterium brasiliense TaxID=180957 RepID=UPI001968BCA4|nr:discoidin domain-containing protein [Pectobacterium brasiliense]QSD33794.1 discoidin domain-containing protein [Pectobacterium brasiliense]